MHALLGWEILLWISLRRKGALLVVRLWLRVVIAIGVRVLVDRRRIGGWWGGAGLLLSPGAVYVPIERWRDTKASIHVDDTD